MSIALSSVSASGQLLIDARLDAIEQALFGRMPRSERLTIVREVESQIHELLAESGVDEASREDVLAVLARLDPPEAYIGDDEDFGGFDRVDRPRTLTVSSSRKTPVAPGRSERLAMAGGIMGLCGLGWLLCMAMISAVVVVGDGLNLGQTLGAVIELALLGTPLVLGPTSLASFLIAVSNRFRSGWLIAGAISSVITLLGTMLGLALAFLS